MKAEEYFGDWIDVIDKEELGAHFDIWKPFVSKLIHNMSYKDNRSISSSILC